MRHASDSEKQCNNTCLVAEAEPAEPVQGEDDEEDEEESQSAITEIRFIPADKSMCK